MDIYLSGVSCLQMKNFTNLRKDVYLDSGSSRYVKFLPFGRFLVKRHKFCTLGRSRYPNWVSLSSTLENWSRASAPGLCQRLEASIPPILQARNQPCLRSTGRDFIKQRWGFTPNGRRWKNLFGFPYQSVKQKIYSNSLDSLAMRIFNKDMALLFRFRELHSWSNKTDLLSVLWCGVQRAIKLAKTEQDPFEVFTGCNFRFNQSNPG